MKAINQAYVDWRQLSVLCLIGLLLYGCGDPDDPGKRFNLLKPSRTGIHFSNTLEETNEMNIITYPDFYSGAGVSVGDIDNDGLPDIFFTGNQVPARLYRNKGNLRFEDITASAGLDNMGGGWYTGACMADINADGYLDIYISRSGMAEPEDRYNLLYINNGDGTFSERAREYGLDNPGYGVNAVFFDYDKDGDLDAYISNQVRSRLNSSQANRLRMISHPFAGDKLYENIGDKFIDVTEESGIYSSENGFTHGAAVGDINNDGWDDLFVSNDFFEYDYLYLNNGDKTFTEVAKSSFRHISKFSMGNDMADFNNDGLPDIMVLDMVAEDNRRLYANTGGADELEFNRSLQQGLHYQYMFNVLHMNNGNETFSEIGMLAGVSRTDWSWAPLFADFDNDGWKDLFITNGIRKDIRNIDWGVNYRNLTQFLSDYTKFEDSQWNMLLGSMPYEKITNYMFRNNGDLTFSKVMEEWGMEKKSWSNGVAYADLDKDGDLDLIINNVDEEAFIYENRTSPSNYTRFTFRGPAKNPMGLGTKVRIYHGDHFQYQQHFISKGYRSSVEPVMHFGLGSDTLIHRVEVTWPDDRILVLNNLKSNRLIQLEYAEAGRPGTDGQSSKNRFFEDVTEQMGWSVRHFENEMNDFMDNSMLPYKLSALGPPLAVGDVNNDGLDDFYLGGAFQYPGQLYIQQISGEFKSSQVEYWKEERFYEDTGAEFFDVDNDGYPDLYVATGGNENIRNNNTHYDRLYLNNGDGTFTKSRAIIPEIMSGGLTVKPYDFDGDGDTDLFVGGRPDPEKYPMPADSYLFLNNNGKLENVTHQVAPGLIDLGIVNDAVWTDYDQDNDPDLIVVGEWMPLTIFRNDSGTFRKIENDGNGLEYTSGWWWSIEAYDMDKDGDDDYILGNMGLNYKFRASKQEPLELFVYDFDNNENMDFVISYHQDGHLFPTVDRTRTINQNSYLKRKILTNDQYAMMTIEDIYGKDLLDSACNKKMYTLASGYLENKGNGKFEFMAFDNYAQVSNINSILIMDVDLDGIEDLILAGNLYTMEVETIRLDAGTGIWMKGDGKGKFISISYTDSGLYFKGDVRALKKIRTENGYSVISVPNNDDIQIIKINPPYRGKFLSGKER